MNNEILKINHISFRINDLEVNPDRFEYFSAAKVTKCGLFNVTDFIKKKISAEYYFSRFKGVKDNAQYLNLKNTSFFQT